VTSKNSTYQSGTIFFKAKHVGRHFSSYFHGVIEGSQRYGHGYRGFCPDFTGCGSTTTPRLLHQCFERPLLRAFHSKKQVLTLHTFCEIISLFHVFHLFSNRILCFSYIFFWIKIPQRSFLPACVSVIMKYV